MNCVIDLHFLVHVKSLLVVPIILGQNRQCCLATQMASSFKKHCHRTQRNCC